MPQQAFTPLNYRENEIDDALLQQKLGSRATITRESGQVVLVVERSNYLEVVKTLRDDPELAFAQFGDVTAADRSELDNFEPEQRFQVITVLYSIKHRKRIRLKVVVPEADCTCPSLTPLFEGANWTEREAYEMFGIRFRGHPNMIRLLTPEYMKHYPLRKEYPVTGMGERDNFPQYEEIQ